MENSATEHQRLKEILQWSDVLYHSQVIKRFDWNCYWYKLYGFSVAGGQIFLNLVLL